MMDNLAIYNNVRQPPKEALKPITGGRLNGKTDINPMWRIKALTEQFGPCGIGWKYTIERQWLEQGSDGQIGAFTNINLYVKYEGEWSEPIPGTGGSMYVEKERNGLYTSDEAYKMALTDAISVSCKALGFAADIYWNSDRSKYDKPPQDKASVKSQSSQSKGITQPQAKRMFALANGDNNIVREVLDTFGYKASTDIPKEKYNDVCKVIEDIAVSKSLPWEGGNNENN